MLNSKMESLSVVMPAFNEEKGILVTINSIEKILAANNIENEIIVVDDGSTDSTYDIIKTTNAIVIRHDQNKGYGAALKTGIRHSRFDRIAIIDSDGTYPAEVLPQLFQRSEEYDMVVGARTGENVHIPIVRRPAKWALTRLANFLTAMKIPDLNSGLRIFKKDTLLNFILLLPDGFSFTTTITIAMLTTNHKVAYVPINYNKRSGNSKIRPIHDTLNFLLLIIRMVLYFTPLKVFLPISIILLLIDLLKVIYDIHTYEWHIATSTIMLGIVAFNTLIIGLIADMISTLRKNL